MRISLTGILALSAVFANSVSYAARRDVGSLTCSQQRESCIEYRLWNGPPRSEGLCVAVFDACMRSGVWDATHVFPYGGVRLTRMIRR